MIKPKRLPINDKPKIKLIINISFEDYFAEMKPLFLFVTLLSTFTFDAQNIPNPYVSIGKPAPKVATLTNGAYDEFLLKDTLVLINGDAISRKTGQLVYTPEENPEIIAQLQKRQKEKFRFLSADPLMKGYPELTPYQFASNRPIEGIDLDGLEFVKKAGQIFYTPPKTGNGNSTDPMTATGQPVLTDYNTSTNQTIINTVSFREVGKNSYQASRSAITVQGKIESKTLKEGGAVILKNGGKVSLTNFAPTLNVKKSYGVLTGLKVNLNYSSADGKSDGVLFLQSLDQGNDKAWYDATSGANPFYYPDHIKYGKFSDNPQFNATPNTTETFKAALLIYEKNGDTYKVVGELEYSFDVKFDEKGKGSVINLKQKFTDLSESKKQP